MKRSLEFRKNEMTGGEFLGWIVAVTVAIVLWLFLKSRFRDDMYRHIVFAAVIGAFGLLLYLHTSRKAPKMINRLEQIMGTDESTINQEKIEEARLLIIKLQRLKSHRDRAEEYARRLEELAGRVEP
jgi:hypothetical protein